MYRQKKLLLLLSFGILLGGTACRKNASNSSTTTELSIENARRYFETQVITGGTGTAGSAGVATGNPRLDVGRAPDWNAAYFVQLSMGKAVVVPVVYQKDLVVTSNYDPGQVWALNQLTKLVIWQDSAGFASELVTGFPDGAGAIGRGAFSGIVFVESWAGKRLNTFRFSGGQIWRKVDRETGDVETEGTAQGAASVVTVCYEMSGYNYSPDDPDGGYYWTEPAGCSTTFLKDNGGGSGGNAGNVAGSIGGVGSGSPIVVNYVGNNVIGNIGSYLQCFGNYGGSDHKYQVTLCVSQPVPGSRTAWSGSASPGSSSGANPVNVGHTYLSFAEIFPDHSVVRNVGFYPAADVYPWSPGAQGQLNNDAGHDYNISLTVTVDNGQFFNMLNYVMQGNNAGYLYNLNTNNCTSFSLHALEQGGVTISTRLGTWPDGGFGYDPGDLGEDIRGMQLTGNMSRNTSYTARPNLYTCQ